MSRITLISAIVALVSGGLSSSHAQTLGDTARQEEERRQTVKTPSKVISNKDLRAVPPPSSPPPAASGAPAADGSAAPADAAAAKDVKADAKDAKADAKDGAKDGAKEGVKDQKYWADRMKQLQDQLRRDRVYADALQTRINSLTSDFVNRDDPAQRATLSTERQNAIDELARLRKSIADTTKAIPDLEEEARRANVPAGWLR